MGVASIAVSLGLGAPAFAGGEGTLGLYLHVNGAVWQGGSALVSPPDPGRHCADITFAGADEAVHEGRTVYFSQDMPPNQNSPMVMTYHRSHLSDCSGSQGYIEIRFHRLHAILSDTDSMNYSVTVSFDHDGRMHISESNLVRRADPRTPLANLVGGPDSDGVYHYILEIG